MVESSDLQTAIPRTQATERLASLQNQQEELNRKRFELELARERAEKAKRGQDVEKADSRRVVRDRYDGKGQGRPDDGSRDEESGDPAPEGGHDPDGPPETGGSLDVRV